MCAMLVFFGGGSGEISGEVRCLLWTVVWSSVLLSVLELTDKQVVLGASSYVGGRREGKESKREREREIDSQGKGKDGQGVYGLSWEGEKKKLLGGCKRDGGGNGQRKGVMGGRKGKGKNK